MYSKYLLNKFEQFVDEIRTHQEELDLTDKDLILHHLEQLKTSLLKNDCVIDNPDCVIDKNDFMKAYLLEESNSSLLQELSKYIKCVDKCVKTLDYLVEANCSFEIDCPLISNTIIGISYDYFGPNGCPDDEGIITIYHESLSKPLKINSSSYIKYQKEEIKSHDMIILKNLFKLHSDEEIYLLLVTFNSTGLWL